MVDHDPHPIAAIHALVGGRLTPGEREVVERHLAACEACRAEREVAARTRRIVREALPPPELPPGLATRIGAALDAESVRGGRAPWRWWAWLLPAAAVAALVALYVILPGPQEDLSTGETIVEAVSSDLGAVQDGSLSLSLPEADPEALEAFFAEKGIDFETRVFDLRMMGLELAGGLARPLAGRPSALFAYVGPAGVLMVCRMYRGSLAELPEPEQRLENDGIAFQVYRRGGRTLVFWKEGAVVCALASEAPPQDVIDLAFAKAVKV